MSYALTTIWFERYRFFPAVLAVAFSAILIAAQTGLVIGLLSMTSLSIDKSTACIWVGYPGVRSVDLGMPIPDYWATRVLAQPEVERIETSVIGFSLWTRVGSREEPPTPEVCTIVGTHMDSDSIGLIEDLRANPDLAARLKEPFTVAVDESELGRLGIKGIGEQAEIFGVRVKVIGLVKGYKSLGGPYVFCSTDTARVLMKYISGQVTYVIAQCKPGADVNAVVERLNTYPQMSAFSADEFSRRSRKHWLLTTKAGVAVGFTALLGLLVGAVVTSQTLYAATAASQREFATLRAMGIPRWRLKLNVLAQSCWVGLFGILVALPITVLIAEIGARVGTEVRLHPLVLLAAGVITMIMSITSGLAALRSFQGVDPAHNIR
jgi:putative ABC transport system permease protein